MIRISSSDRSATSISGIETLSDVEPTSSSDNEDENDWMEDDWRQPTPVIDDVFINAVNNFPVEGGDDWIDNYIANHGMFM